MSEKEIKTINELPLCDQKAREEIEQLKGTIANGSGLNATAKNLLITILRSGLYSENQSENITKLETALASGGEDEPDEPIIPDEPDTPTVTLTSISATYSGGDVEVGTSVNSLSGIVVTAKYSDGSSQTVTNYTLSGSIGEGPNTITVSYQGKTTNFTVTGVAESGGDVSAEFVTDGLLGYWDFRNPTEPVVKEWHWAYPSNEGTGGLYLSALGGAKGTQSLPTFDTNYGTSNSFFVMTDDTTYPNSDGATFGTEFTMVSLIKGFISEPTGTKSYWGVRTYNFPPNWLFRATYNTSSGISETPDYGSGNNDDITDYNFLVRRVNGSEMKVVMDTSSMVYDGTSYEDFVTWYDKAAKIEAYGTGTNIAFAVYNRALSDVEIEQMRAFMKTLEVN